jgi:hypothetical protein
MHNKTFDEPSWENYSMWNSKTPIFLHHFVESFPQLSTLVGMELLSMLERHQSMDEGTEMFISISSSITHCCTTLSLVVLYLAKHREYWLVDILDSSCVSCVLVYCTWK